MKNRINEIVPYLKDIYHILTEIRDLYALPHRSLDDDRLLDKQQVISMLNISDTTYRRYVKAGRLRPMRLHGIDMYREDDLLQELRESRRKGRC